MAMNATVKICVYKYLNFFMLCVAKGYKYLNKKQAGLFKYI